MGLTPRSSTTASCQEYFDLTFFFFARRLIHFGAINFRLPGERHMSIQVLSFLSHEKGRFGIASRSDPLHKETADVCP